MRQRLKTATRLCAMLLSGRRVFVGMMIFATACAAGEEPIPDLSGFKRISGQYQGISENFNGGADGWSLGKGFKLAPGEGVNGSAALFFERTTPGAEPEFARKQFPAPPPGLYRFSIRYRLENVEVHKRLEVARDGPANNMFPLGMVSFRGSSEAFKPIKSYVPRGQIKMGEWIEFAEEFTVSSGAESLVLGLAMEHWKPVMTGRLWLDDVQIEPAQQVAILYPVMPPALNISDSSGRIEIGAYHFAGEWPDSRYAMLINAAGRSRLAVDRNQLFSAEFGEFREKKIPVKAVLLDMEEKLILAEYEYSLFRNKVPPVARATSFDSSGRFLVSGAPFFPVGICSWMPMTEADLKRCAAAGFNFIYMEGLLARPNPMDELSQLLAAAQRHRLKVTVNLKDQISCAVGRKLWPAITRLGGKEGLDNVTAFIVDKFKSHPALMAWVVTDENPRDELDQVRRLRELIASRDPFHLTWSVTNLRENFPYYLSSADVFEHDRYPIHTVADQNLKQMNDNLKEGRSISRGLPFLFISQSFNWGAEGFAKKDGREQYLKKRWPTEQETTAMALLPLIHGVNGIAFFSYDAIWTKAEKVDPGSAARYWPAVVKTAKMLRLLEPFVLATVPDPQFKMDVSQGQVEARAMQSGAGKTAVLLVAIGPGDSVAQVVPPTDGPYRSIFGLSTRQADGAWLFKASNIGCDMLLSE